MEQQYQEFSSSEESTEKIHNNNLINSWFDIPKVQHQGVKHNSI